MARLDRDKIEEIKTSINIVDVISQYVQLSKTGSNYLGLCPFHNEKTPSFNVNGVKQFYHCFGCGKSGDVYKFIEDYKQVSFMDAVVEVAEIGGLTLELDRREAKANPHQPIYDLHNQAARIYHTVLTSTEAGEQARDYLYSRGITDELIERFSIGLSLKDQDFLYQSVSQKFEEAVLTNSGLITFAENRIFDSFRGRIMFPLKNEDGQVIAFSGRVWQADDVANKTLAKYKNSTTTPIFNKSEALYNIDQAKKSIKKNQEVYLMEGFLDVIAAYENGMTNAVASMGTALTEGHIRQLRRLTKKFILVYDGDKAGQAAIYKALNMLAADEVEIVRIPDGLDPDEYNKTYPNSLGDLMTNSRIVPVEFLMDYLRPENLSNLQSQLAFIELLAPKISAIASLTAQDAYIKRLVEILPDFEYNQVESAVNKRREHVSVISQVDQDAFFFDDGMAPPPPPDFEDYAFDAQAYATDSPKTFEKKYTQIERSELHLLHRMIYHRHVLTRVSSVLDFQFIHQRYQQLFEQMKDMADVTEASLLNHMTGDDLETVYEVISSVNVPDDVSEQEIDDLLKNFVQAAKSTQLQSLQEQLKQAKQTGNKALELQLTLQIIAQTQQDGV